MALIAMCVYSTDENKKDACLAKTLDSLLLTVDFTRHNIGFYINGQTAHTRGLLDMFCESVAEDNCYPLVITGSENIGTAEGINRIWQENEGGDVHKLKMDDDITTGYKGWLDELVNVVETDKSIGIAGLKRKDCDESPSWPENNFYHSKLLMLPHVKGHPWQVVEQVKHVMGSCQLYSERLLRKIGYLYQMEGNLYGFDDSLAGVRCEVAGMKSVFLPHIEIDHIDPGGTQYTQWKGESSGKYLKNGEYGQVVNEYRNGTRPIYYNPFE